MNNKLDWLESIRGGGNPSSCSRTFNFDKWSWSIF